MQKIFLDIWRRYVFIKYRNSLPIKSRITKPKMEYHILADAVVWDDEGLKECNPNLENEFRSVIQYRTDLITGSKGPSIYNKKDFELAQKYFPNWIGFDSKRCSYDSELSDRIQRIRNVSEWKMNKILDDTSN